jgi:hypothetical protein
MSQPRSIARANQVSPRECFSRLARKQGNRPSLTVLSFRQRDHGLDLSRSIVPQALRIQYSTQTIRNWAGQVGTTRTGRCHWIGNLPGAWASPRRGYLICTALLLHRRLFQDADLLLCCCFRRRLPRSPRAAHSFHPETGFSRTKPVRIWNMNAHY